MYYNEPTLPAWIPFVWLLLFILYYFMLHAINRCANRYGRIGGAWVVLAIIISPFIAALLLFLYGETKEHCKIRIIEEEKWKHISDDKTQSSNIEENVVELDSKN